MSGLEPPTSTLRTFLDGLPDLRVPETFQMRDVSALPCPPLDTLTTYARVTVGSRDTNRRTLTRASRRSRLKQQCRADEWDSLTALL